MVDINENKTAKQTNPIKKGIHKLEELGKKGKLHKLVTITLEHFEFLKNSMNEYSLKILAYIIKGCFISINKYYQTFIKEIGEFIDINIRGIIKQKRQIKKKNIQKKIEESEKFTLQNLSLFSENTFFEKFLENSNMTEHIQKTLKQINKSFSGIDFENMNPEEKKEYLQKHFIKPLTDNVPMTSDFFVMRKNEQTQAENGKQFADYINFDLETIAENVIQSLHNSSAKQTQSQRFLSQNNDIPLLMALSQGIQLYDSPNSNKQKVQGLKSDAEIEISLEEYMHDIDSQLKENDSEDAYVKNLKEIFISKSLSKFIDLNKEKELAYSKYYNEHSDYHSQEQLRNNNHNDCLSSNKNSPQFMQYGNMSLSQSEVKSLVVNENNNNMLADIRLQKNNSNQSHKHQLSDYKDLMKEKVNIQSELCSILSSIKEYDEITMITIVKKLSSKIPTITNKSKPEQVSCLFYNLLIVCQNEQKSIKQSDCFGQILYI